MLSISGRRSLARWGWLVGLGFALGCSGGSGDADGSGGGGDGIQGGYTLEEFSPPEKNVIVGQVVSGNGAPVAGATARVGTASATTNKQGYYFVEVAPSNRIVVVFEAPGFAKTTRTASLHEDGRVVANAVLLRQSPAVPVVPGEPTPVAGGAVVVPEGAAITRSGQPATAVRVRATPVDIENRQFIAAPGDFSAVGEQGGVAQLETFGMAEYALVSDTGEELEIAPGQTVAIEMLLPANTTLQLGESVPAWSFDEEQGRWVIEGQGTVVESSTEPGRLAFRADVPHFSWWNADKELETTCVRGTVLNCDGTPAAGADVRLDGMDYDGSSTSHAGATGEFCALARTNSKVEVWAAAGWGQERRLARAEINTGGGLSGPGCDGGPCTEVTITLPCTAAESEFDCHQTWFAPCKGCLKGEVLSKDGEPVVSAMVEVDTGKTAFSVLTDKDGQYCAPAAAGQTAVVTATAKGIGAGTTQAVASEGSCPNCAEAPTIELAASGSDNEFDFSECLTQIGGVTVDEVISNGADPNVLLLNSGWGLYDERTDQEGGATRYGLELTFLPAGTTTDIAGRPYARISLDLPAAPVVGERIEVIADDNEQDYSHFGRMVARMGGTVGLSNESYEIGSWDNRGSGFVQFSSVPTATGEMAEGIFEFEFAPRCAPQAAAVVIRGSFMLPLSSQSTWLNFDPTSETLTGLQAWLCSLYGFVLGVYEGDAWGQGLVSAKLDEQPIAIEPGSIPGTSRYQSRADDLFISIYGVEVSAQISINHPVSGYNPLGDGYATMSISSSECIWYGTGGGVSITGFTGAESDTWLSGDFEINYTQPEFATGDCPPHVLSGQFGAPVCY